MRPVRTAARTAGAALLTAALGGVAGCGQDDPAAAYCGLVEEHQAELTDIVGGGGPDALLGALGIFRELQDQAPRDLADEWQQVVGRVAALDEALRAAGLDPAAYDREQPPAGLTDAARARVDAAARELVAPATTAAVGGLEQQARDVCGTPLVL
ncbi:hypothetical protein [Nocardioides pantholopis]|uniref:hypothetical protein n=1 Tax=Nocardioides pantholopis TaxID=2483798 RepID=UPI000F08A88E|nr:hypothetical protein [Nocardioides pantholopis]